MTHSSRAADGWVRASGLGWLALAGVGGCSSPGSPPPAAEAPLHREEAEAEDERWAELLERDEQALLLLHDRARGSLYERLQGLPAPLLALIRLREGGQTVVTLRLERGAQPQDPPRIRVSVRSSAGESQRALPALELETTALPDTPFSVQLVPLPHQRAALERRSGGELYLLHAGEERFLLSWGEEPPIPLRFGPLPRVR